MPYDYTIFTEQRLIVLRGTGVVTDLDVRKVDEQIRADPDSNPDFHELIDIREVDDFQVNVKAISEMGLKTPFFSPYSRRVILIPDKPSQALRNVLDLIREGVMGEIAVHTEEQAARKWLAEIKG